MFLFNVRTGNASVKQRRAVSRPFPTFVVSFSLHYCLIFDVDVSVPEMLWCEGETPFPLDSPLLLPSDVAGCTLTFPRLPAFIPLDLSNRIFLTVIGTMWRRLGDLFVISISVLLSCESSRLRWRKRPFDDADGKMSESASSSTFDIRLVVSAASQSDSSPVIGTCRKLLFFQLNNSTAVAYCSVRFNWILYCIIGHCGFMILCCQMYAMYT